MVTKVRKKTLSLQRKIFMMKGLSFKALGIIMENEFLALEEHIVAIIKTVYDPEIPVNIYDLGLIYKIENADGMVTIDMTLTAPNCPAADFIVEDVRMKVESIDGVKSCAINLTFEPEWNRDMMSEEAQLELGLL